MSSTRLLKNARLINKPTAENDQYTFSSSYCLSIYPINAAYTFIPKNACSSLRFSVAVANGFLADLSDIEWIHWNNQTFIASQREVCLASYTFVILRCPFTRVASSFLDLIVEASFDFKDSAGNKLSINFNDFLFEIKTNLHYRYIGFFSNIIKACLPFFIVFPCAFRSYSCNKFLIRIIY